MIIVNADDWGRSIEDTEAALQCAREGLVGSVSAMVWMADSARAAELALRHGLDVGLHLNFTQPFDAPPDDTLALQQRAIGRFLTAHRYAQVLYHPLLRDAFAAVCRAQHAEFGRLYGAPPSHIDGHHHMHLCSNVLWDGLLPEGARVRRSFSFEPHDKGVLNRAYRRGVDRLLARRHRLTDGFFGLSHNLRDDRWRDVLQRAHASSVELMVHPAVAAERACLQSGSFRAALAAVPRGRHADR